MDRARFAVAAVGFVVFMCACGAAGGLTVWAALPIPAACGAGR